MVFEGRLLAKKFSFLTCINPFEPPLYLDPTAPFLRVPWTGTPHYGSPQAVAACSLALPLTVPPRQSLWSTDRDYWYLSK